MSVVAPEAPSVAVEDLHVAWEGSPVFAGFDLQVAAGSFVAVVGPSGCGKSTLLRVLAGLEVPAAGRATVGDVDVVGRPGSCAWLPQRDALLPWRRVLDNAVLGAEVAGRPRGEARAEAVALLERFGLAGTERRWPSELSGGMRQRVAVLRTFLTPAPVLALDEPFGALDALTRRSMQTWLGEVWQERTAARGATAVLVTHDVEEALLLADRVVVLSSGPAESVADEAVPFARPRAAALVGDPAFVELRRRLLAALGL